MNSQSTPPTDSPYANLETVATALSSHPVQSSKPLVNAVFSIPHHLNISDFAVTALSPALANAEEGYWQGSNGGIREKDLVVALNSLAARFNLPEYAKTTDSQVRFLRMQLMASLPRFMALGALTRTPKHISDHMSPMQAVHLTLTLIDQKFWDTRYQVEPAIWEQQRHAHGASLEVAPDDSQLTHSIRKHDFPQAKELDRHINLALTKLSDYEGIQIVSETLHTLGVL